MYQTGRIFLEQREQVGERESAVQCTSKITLIKCQISVLKLMISKIWKHWGLLHCPIIRSHDSPLEYTITWIFANRWLTLIHTYFSNGERKENMKGKQPMEIKEWFPRKTSFSHYQQNCSFPLHVLLQSWCYNSDRKSEPVACHSCSPRWMSLLRTRSWRYLERNLFPQEKPVTVCWVHGKQAGSHFTLACWQKSRAMGQSWVPFSGIYKKLDISKQHECLKMETLLFVW